MTAKEIKRSFLVFEKLNNAAGHIAIKLKSLP